jgi:hypothetical protein
MGNDFPNDLVGSWATYLTASKGEVPCKIRGAHATKGDTYLVVEIASGPNKGELVTVPAFRIKIGLSDEARAILTK